jgi:hypothetical protein
MMLHCKGLLFQILSSNSRFYNASKNGLMDSEYRTANDFDSNTGQRSIEEGQDITEIVIKNSSTIAF